MKNLLHLIMVVALAILITLPVTIYFTGPAFLVVFSAITFGEQFFAGFLALFFTYLIVLGTVEGFRQLAIKFGLIAV